MTNSGKRFPDGKISRAKSLAIILWQSKNSVKKLKEVKEVLGSRISDEFIADIEAALHIAPMNIRITPYVFALIDWNNPNRRSASQTVFADRIANAAGPSVLPGRLALRRR